MLDAASWVAWRPLPMSGEEVGDLARQFVE